MIHAATWAASTPRRILREPANFRGYVVPMIEQAAEQGGGQGFVVEQNPDWLLPVHFHLQDQFQLVAAGSGTIGRDPLQPLSVHFASAQSAYGPIRSGADGLSYYTLRAYPDVSAWYMPESRSRMTPGLPKRHAFGQPVTPSTPAARATRQTLVCESVLAPEDDGLAACLLRVPPGTTLLTGDLPGLGSYDRPRFYYVAGGSLHCQGQWLGERDLVYTTAGERATALAAGADGLDLMVLQFPESSLRPQAVG